MAERGMRRFLAPAALVALTACSGGVDEGNRVDSGTAEPTIGTSVQAEAQRQAAQATTTIPRILVVGHKVELQNGDTIQVHSYTPNVAASNRFATPAAGTAFSVIDVEGCARAASPTGVVNPFSFELQMPDNTRADATFLPVKTPELRSGAQAPGDCIRGNVAFEVPTGVKPVAVVFSNFGTVVKWNIP